MHHHIQTFKLKREKVDQIEWDKKCSWNGFCTGTHILRKFNLPRFSELTLLGKKTIGRLNAVNITQYLSKYKSIPLSSILKVGHAGLKSGQRLAMPKICYLSTYNHMAFPQKQCPNWQRLYQKTRSITHLNKQILPVTPTSYTLLARGTLREWAGPPFPSHPQATCAVALNFARHVFVLPGKDLAKSDIFHLMRLTSTSSQVPNLPVTGI